MILNKIKNFFIIVEWQILYLFFKLIRFNWYFSLKDKINFWDKTKSDDCSIQSINSALSVFHSDIPDQAELYNEFKSLWIIEENKWFIYSNLQRSKLLEHYQIKVMPYFPISVLVYDFVYLKKPCVISVKNPDWGWHLVIITEMKIKKWEIEKIWYYDNQISKIVFLDWLAFIRKYNFRWIVFDKSS